MISRIPYFSVIYPRVLSKAQTGVVKPHVTGITVDFMVNGAVHASVPFSEEGLSEKQLTCYRSTEDLEDDTWPDSVDEIKFELTVSKYKGYKTMYLLAPVILNIDENMEPSSSAL